MTMTAKSEPQEPQLLEEVADDRMLVQLTVRQLRDAIRIEVDRAIGRVLEAKPPVKSAKWIDAVEAADHFRVTPQTIRNWCKDGAPHRTFGTGKTPVYRIDLATFEAWVDSRSRNHG